jgi:hypothetical protein
MNILDTLYQDMKSIISSIVIKYEKSAKSNETAESLKNSDRYIASVTKLDTFNSYSNFDKQIILDSGITHDLALAEEYSKNKNKIPNNLRNAVLLKQREYIINNYEEKNNYYRMLIGLPDLEDEDFIYIDSEIATPLNIPTDVPIHLLQTEHLIILNSKGIINEIINNNPTKSYLKFLGEQKVDLVLARSAKNFSVLRVTKNITESFYDNFNNLYEQCREYFMTVIYIKEYGKSYDLYDNFIALMIMVMTFQRIISTIFKNGILRDFYDLDSIQMMFDAYNVPFISNLPLDYQRQLVKNLNNLLRYKSTDKVLYDICSLLGYERIRIYKYFLVKEHILDSNENPIFLYKEIQNEDGSISIVEDKEQMYRFYFQTVDLKERNVALALSDITNRIDYDQVVTSDPFWWDDDDDLKKTLYDSDFNYVESKYLNMNIMYKMSEMLIECIYSFKMLIDKKNEINSFEVELPKLFSDKKINIFNLVIFTFALICKKNKFKGNILIEPSKILSVLGFNFKENINLIKQFIIENSRMVDPKTLEYLNHLTIVTPEDINKLYDDIKGLNDFLVQKLSTTQNIKEYKAYKKLFEALMVTTETTSIFQKSDGSIATTYLEYLEDVDPELYSFIVDIESEKLSEYIDYVIGIISSIVPSLKYTFIINESNNIVLEAIIKLARFFKSYTTDLLSMNIIYIMDSRYYNMIRMIEDIRYFGKELNMQDILHLQYIDYSNLYSFIYDNDYTALFLDYINLVRLTLEERYKLKHKIICPSKSFQFDTELNLKYQDLSNIAIEILRKDKINYKDKIKLFYEEQT